MNLKNKIILFLSKTIKKIQKRPALFDKKAPKILLVSTTALGDSLWATPILETIRKNYPKATLNCLCSKTAYNVFRKNPNVNELFVLKKPYLFFAPFLFMKLKKKKYQAVLVMHASQRFIFPFCFHLNSEIFTSTKGWNKNLDALLSHAMGKNEKFPHEIERRMDILKTIGITNNKSYKLSYPLTKKENLPIKKRAINIILHPGAKDLFRAWPINSYIKLGLLLSEKYDCNIIITGTEKEKELLSKINIPKSINLCGKLTLNQLACLFKQSDLLITGDTGPLHLASALNVKTIAIFVPTDPAKFGPYHNSDTLIMKKIQNTCLNCKKRKCTNPKCFQLITPEEVFENCQKILLKQNN